LGMAIKNLWLPSFFNKPRERLDFPSIFIPSEYWYF
jgi:hypothetical protein